jgi:hypothetical protein
MGPDARRPAAGLPCSMLSSRSWSQRCWRSRGPPSLRRQRSPRSRGQRKLHVRIGPGRGSGQRKLEPAEPRAPAKRRPARSASETMRQRSLWDSELRSPARRPNASSFPSHARGPTRARRRDPARHRAAGPTLNLTGYRSQRACRGWQSPDQQRLGPRLESAGSALQLRAAHARLHQVLSRPVRGRAITEIWARRAGRYAAMISGRARARGLAE